MPWRFPCEFIGGDRHRGVGGLRGAAVDIAVDRPGCCELHALASNVPTQASQRSLHPPSSAQCLELPELRTNLLRPVDHHRYSLENSRPNRLPTLPTAFSQSTGVRGICRREKTVAAFLALRGVLSADAKQPAQFFSHGDADCCHVRPPLSSHCLLGLNVNGVNMARGSNGASCLRIFSAFWE